MAELVSHRLNQMRISRFHLFSLVAGRYCRRFETQPKECKHLFSPSLLQDLYQNASGLWIHNEVLRGDIGQPRYTHRTRGRIASRAAKASPTPPMPPALRFSASRYDCIRFKMCDIFRCPAFSA